MNKQHELFSRNTIFFAGVWQKVFRSTPQFSSLFSVLISIWVKFSSMLSSFLRTNISFNTDLITLPADVEMVSSSKAAVLLSNDLFSFGLEVSVQSMKHCTLKIYERKRKQITRMNRTNTCFGVLHVRKI